MYATGVQRSTEFLEHVHDSCIIINFVIMFSVEPKPGGGTGVVEDSTATLCLHNYNNTSIDQDLLSQSDIIGEVGWKSDAGTTACTTWG